MPSLLWDVRSALLTIFKTAVGSEVTVFDGPLSHTTVPPRFLLVGTDGGDDGTGDSADGATSEQTESPMANNWRAETGEVTCAAWAWDGATAFPILRTQAIEIVSACEEALYVDRTLGGLLQPQGYMADFAGFRLRETQEETGAVVRAAFTVKYRALITT